MPVSYGILTLPMVYRPPTHGILTPLPMVYRPLYPWYIDPPTHSISTPLPMVYRPHYPWYIDPPTHGILTPLPMEYRPPYLWYIKPSLMVLWTPPSLLVEMRGVQFTMKGFKIQWQKIYPWVKISYVNWPRGQFTMGFKIPYDTGTTYIFFAFSLMQIWLRLEKNWHQDKCVNFLYFK
jgi:hypothetical protein